jgi:Sodium:solute symporter family
LGVEVFGLVMGLGFVLSFGYWCTDSLVVQRAMAAHDMNAARRTPLIAALPKMVFPVLVILPGLIAIALPTTTAPSVNASSSSPIGMNAPGKGLIPAKVDETTGAIQLDADGKPILDYDLAIPNMLIHYFPTGILGLGLTALLASFMSGMAGNVTAFNTVWTYDIYQSYIHKKATDEHYLWMGRMATVFGILVSIAAAYAATRFNNIMDFLQLVFAFVNAPLFATFLLGMFWKRTTGHAAFFGLLLGTSAAALPSRSDNACRQHSGNQRWMDRQHSYVPQPDGTKFLDRDLGLGGLLRDYHSDQPDYQSTQGRSVERPRLFAHRTHERRTRAFLQTAAGTRAAGVGAHTEPDLLVGGNLGLDIRTPIGAFFALIGLVLSVYGLLGSKAIYQQSLGINVNLLWGIVLLVFGVFLASSWFSRHGGMRNSKLVCPS